jgi:hypothetical protein
MLNFAFQFFRKKVSLGKKYRFFVLSVVTAIQIVLFPLVAQARDPRNFVSNFFDDLFSAIWSVIGPWVTIAFGISVIWCLVCVISASADTSHKNGKLPALDPHIQKQLNAIDTDSTLSAENKKDRKRKILENHLEEEKRKLQAMITHNLQRDQEREQRKKELNIEIAELEGKLEIEEAKERHQEQLSLIAKIEKERIQRDNKIRDFRNRTGREPNSWEI